MCKHVHAVQRAGVRITHGVSDLPGEAVRVAVDQDLYPAVSFLEALEQGCPVVDLERVVDELQVGLDQDQDMAVCAFDQRINMAAEADAEDQKEIGFLGHGTWCELHLQLGRAR